MEKKNKDCLVMCHKLAIIVYFSEIVAMENPDLEQLRIEMTRKVNSSRREVKMNEDGFLKYMAEVKGNILEPKDLFLNNLKDLVVSTSRLSLMH